MSRSISRSSFDARSSRAGGSLAMIDTVVDESRLCSEPICCDGARRVLPACGVPGRPWLEITPGILGSDRPKQPAYSPCLRPEHSPGRADRVGDENIQRTSAASAMDVGAQIALLACLLSNLKGRKSSAVLILAKQTQRPKKTINQRVCGLCAASAGPGRAIRLTLCALGRCLNGRKQLSQTRTSERRSNVNRNRSSCFLSCATAEVLFIR